MFFCILFLARTDFGVEPKSELDKIKKNTNIRLWLQPDQQTVDVIVMWESYVVDGDSSTLQETVELEQKESPKKDNHQEEIEGIILDIKKQDITVNLMTSQELEDGSTVAFVGLGKNIVKFHVKLDYDTNYIKRTSTDMGKTYTDAKATKEDLTIDQSLHITGVKQGEEFMATSIIIYEFK